MIVITGATGRVGSKTAIKLLEKGKKVIVISRDAAKLKDLENSGAIIASGDLHDANFLTQTFKGAEAVLLIIPPNYQAIDVSAHQQKASDVQIEAIKNSGVKNVVFISSQGAQDTEKSGIVNGLARHELALNSLPDDVNVISLRPSYFMENLFNHIGTIKSMGIIGSPMKSDVKMPLIYTDDIATVAAEKLSNLNFKGKSHLDLLGSNNYTNKEVASILGNAIGKPDMPYVEFPFEDSKKAMMQYGMSESVANAFNQMYEGINSGVFSHGNRTEETTTPTTLQQFAENVFKHAAM